MISGTGIPQNPQVAIARRRKPEDAATHITVSGDSYQLNFLNA